MTSLSAYFPGGNIFIVQEVVGVYIDSNSTATISQVVNVPAHSQGDLLVAVVMHRTAGGALTPPAGWSLYSSDIAADSYQKLSVFFKVATSSEPANYTWTQASSERVAGMMASIAGASSINARTITSNSGTTTIAAATPTYGVVNLVVYTWTITNPSGEAVTMTGDGVVAVSDANTTEKRLAVCHTLYDTTATLVHTNVSANGAVVVTLAGF